MTIFLFLLFMPCMLLGQMIADTSFLKIEANLLTQLKAFPQEKIHLHTDRDFYVPGEKIWFRAYLVDAATHRYPTNSRYIYVELIDVRDSLVSRVMIRPENELYYGHLFLSEIIPEGNYTLRAYTRYMENLGDDYFFKKNIRIGNLNRGNNLPLPPLQRGIERGNRRNPENLKNLAANPGFDVSFFPEGGNLVEGAFCKVAFKALTPSGTAETISGKLVDEAGAEITAVQTFHAGMGAFSYFQEPGKRYFLKCHNENGLEKQFELPQANPHARTLTVLQRNGKNYDWHP